MKITKETLEECINDYMNGADVFEGDDKEDYCNNCWENDNVYLLENISSWFDNAVVLEFEPEVSTDGKIFVSGRVKINATVVAYVDEYDHGDTYYVEVERTHVSAIAKFSIDIEDGKYEDPELEFVE